VKFPSWVFHLKLSAREVGLFAYLYLLKNREDRVCITYSELEKRLGARRSLLVKSLKNLEKKGLLSVVKLYFRYKEVFSHRNCYHLIAPISEDPDLPLKEVLSQNLSLQEKGLLLYLFYLAGEEGDTFKTKSQILSAFKPRPHKAFQNLVEKGYLKVSPIGVKVVMRV